MAGKRVQMECPPVSGAPRGTRVLETARRHVLALPTTQGKGMPLTPLNIGLFVAVCIVVVVVYFVRKRR